MRQILIIILCSVISVAAMSQHEDYYISSDTTDIYIEGDSPDLSPFSNKKKLSLGVNIGSSYSSYGNGVLTSYTSPELRYRATDKLTITVGVMASYTSFGGGLLNSENEQLDYAGRMAQFYTYASGTYQVNDRLRIRAGGVYEMTPNTNYNNFKSGHIGFDLQLSENTFLNADFQISNGYYSPAMYYSNGGVFGNSNNHNSFMNPHQSQMGW